MKKIALPLLVILIVTVFTSCKKDDDTTTPSTPNTFELLTAKTWITTDATLKGVNVFATLETCYSDNIYYFIVDGTFITDEGATKCNANDEQFIKGTWELTENNTKLKTNGKLIEISEITANKLVIVETTPNGNILFTMSPAK